MFQKIKHIVGFILLTVFLLTFAYFAYIKIADGAPSLFGFRVLRVYSDSMEPELSVGEVILVKSVDPATLEKGDVISYSSQTGKTKGKIITRQISQEPYEKDGVYYFTTRGIKPDAVDDPEITDDQIKGEVLYKIPLLGTVYDFFSSWYGILAFIALMIIAFGEDIMNFIMSLRKDKEFDDFAHVNANDIKQSESIESMREQEFEGIITNLDDPDF